MPSREPTCFGPPGETAMQKRRSQCDGAKTRRANASSHTAHPPGTLREAEPLPRRARADSSSADFLSPAAAQAASARAAKPLELEASPAAVGKSLREAMRARLRIPAASRSARARRGSSERPSSVNESATKSPSSPAVVVSSLSSAAETQPAPRNSNASSPLPQYFT